MTKPIRSFELLQRVRTHLELKFSRDQLVRKVKDCDTLTAMVAHDLKSPLASIRFSVQMLAESPDLNNPRFQEIFESLIDSTDVTLGFIDDFLTRNAAANTMALETFQPFPLDDLVRQIAVRFDQYGMEKDIHVEFASEEAMEAFADPFGCIHIVENLLSNALKFAPRGSVVEVQVKRGNPGFARVHVLDRGPGISAEDRLRLFQRYVRLTAKPTGGETSTGLGLSIAKQLADAMHGSLAYEPRVGGGADFILQLPTRPVT